jgi:hypothetical protein
VPAAVTLLLVLLALQGTAPLRKSDLVRLLSGAALSPTELAQLVRRNCLTFNPTDRDRSDFRQLGADAALLSAVDACARQHAARFVPVPVPPAAARRLPPAPPPAPPAAPKPVPVVSAAAERSNFVSGGGQRGTVAARLPRALVFEVRDSTGAALADRTVTFTGINARIEPGAPKTDASGQVRVGVTLGERVGSATVLASVGTVEKQVAFNVAAGPAQELVVFCRESSVSGRFAIRPDSIVALRVVAQDAYSNPTPLLGLRAAVADARIFRVLQIAQDSVSGMVHLKPEHPGTTSLAVIANGMRQYLSVTVPPKAAPGKVDCR